MWRHLTSETSHTRKLCSSLFKWNTSLRNPLNSAHLFTDRLNICVMHYIHCNRVSIALSVMFALSCIPTCALFMTHCASGTSIVGEHFTMFCLMVETRTNAHSAWRLDSVVKETTESLARWRMVVKLGRKYCDVLVRERGRLVSSQINSDLTVLLHAAWTCCMNMNSDTYLI